jgi:hypothetical protein
VSANPKDDGFFGLRKLSKRERVERYGAPPESFDDALPEIARLSEHMLGVPELTQPLDEALTKYGLARVLKEIRALCDSRHTPDFFADFEGETGVDWHEAASEIERLLGHPKIRDLK